MDDRAFCSCLRVKYDPEHISNGAMCERWVCDQCGMEFVKRVMVTQRFTDLEREIEALSTRIDGAGTIEIMMDENREVGLAAFKLPDDMQPGEIRTFKLVPVEQDASETIDQQIERAR